MIEQKIKELLETWFTNIQNWETNKIYFHNNYQLELIKFDFDDIKSERLSFILWKMIEICKKYSTYLIEPEIKYVE